MSCSSFGSALADLSLTQPSDPNFTLLILLSSRLMFKFWYYGMGRMVQIENEGLRRADLGLNMSLEKVVKRRLSLKVAVKAMGQLG